MGKLLYFSKRRQPETALIDEEILWNKVITGEAYLLGAFWSQGADYKCYRLEHDDKITLILAQDKQTPD